MKRCSCLIICVFILIAGYLFGKTPIENRAMEIGMTVNASPRIFISQEPEGMENNPIDLNSDGISDPKGGGIKIAEWSIYSNTDYIKVTIDAGDLVLISDSQIKIPYLLYFDSSHYDNGRIESSHFYVKSEGYDGLFNSLLEENNIYEFDTQTSLGVNFSGNQIKFILTDEDISKKTDGIYSATVKITIEAKEGGEI